MSGVCRGRPKKKTRGPQAELTSSSGDVVGFRNLSVKSKRAYKKAENEEDESPAAINRRGTVALEDPIVGLDEAVPEDLTKGRGRPALDPIKGPMKESSLKRRRVLLNQKAKEDQRNKEHISEVRR